MSLLDDFARSCVLMEKKRVPDGAGGDCSSHHVVRLREQRPGVPARIRAESRERG